MNRTRTFVWHAGQQEYVELLICRGCGERKTRGFIDHHEAHCLSTEPIFCAHGVAIADRCGDC